MGTLILTSLLEDLAPVLFFFPSGPELLLPRHGARRGPAPLPQGLGPSVLLVRVQLSLELFSSFVMGNQ